MIESVLFGLIFAAMILSAFLVPRAFLFLLGASIPLIVPRLGAAIGIEWYKIIGPMAIGLAIFRRRRSIKVRDTHVHLGVALIIYATVVTCIWMYLEYAYLERYRLAIAMELGGGIAQNKLKMPVQLGSVLGQFLTMFVVPLWARNVQDCRVAIWGALVGAATSVAGGAIYWLGFGLATVNTTGDMGILGYEDLAIPRLGGLTGEPKLLGIVLTTLVLFLACERLFRSKLKVGRASWLAIGGIALFATFSSSAWSAVIGGGMVLAAVTVVWGRRSQLVFLLVTVAVLALVVTSVGFVGDLFQMRIADRIFGEGDLSQQKDLYVFRAFADNPFDIFFGYGLGGGDLATIPYVEWLQLKYQRTPTPGVTGVRLLADLGVIGLGLIVGLSAKWAAVLAKRGDRAGAAFMLAGLAGALLGSMIGLTVYYFVAGALMTAGALRAREGALGT